MSGTILFLHLLGGVALLLWAVRMVRTGMTRAFGSDLRRWLMAGAGTPLSGFGSGLAVTALLQSSTATALIASSFAGRALLGTAAALAIMLGADVGSALV